MDASSRWLGMIRFLPPLSEVKSREERGRFLTWTSISCTNIWRFWGCFRWGNQDCYQSIVRKWIVTDQIWKAGDTAADAYCPRSERKLPRPGSQITRLTAPSCWIPPTSHIKTCLRVIIAVNCRSGKEPITSRLCLLVNAANTQLLRVCHRKYNCKQTLWSYVLILEDNCCIVFF